MAFDYNSFSDVFFFLGINYAALFFFHWIFWTTLFIIRTKHKNVQNSMQKSLTNRLLYIFWKIQSSKFLLQRLTLSFCNCPLCAKKKGLQHKMENQGSSVHQSIYLTKLLQWATLWITIVLWKDHNQQGTTCLIVYMWFHIQHILVA